MNLAAFRDEVAKQVEARLGQRRWFRGVCMDGVNAHYPNLLDAVEHAESETIYYAGERMALERDLEASARDWEIKDYTHG